MSRQLATFVHVADEQGGMHVFGPKDTVPDWAVGRIANPKAWVGGKLPAPAESADDERARLLARLAELDATEDPAGDPDPGADAGGDDDQGDDDASTATSGTTSRRSRKRATE